MSIHPNKGWQKSHHLSQQGRFYKTTRVRGADTSRAQRVDASLPEPVTETKLSGEIQVDAAGRVIIPGEPQGPSRIER